MCSRPSFMRSAFHRHITVSGERFSPRVFFFAVLAVTFLVHTSYLANGFVWLDHGDIESGRAIVVDLRNEFTLDEDSVQIPGALRLTPEELEERHGEIPRDRDIILYCT